MHNFQSKLHKKRLYVFHISHLIFSTILYNIIIKIAVQEAEGGA